MIRKLVASTLPEQAERSHPKLCRINSATRSHIKLCALSQAVVKALPRSQSTDTPLDLVAEATLSDSAAGSG